MAHFLTPLLRSKATAGLRIERTGIWLAEIIHGAFDSRTRRTGLLGRDSLPAEQGLVIAPCQAVHTFAMRFPIDIVGVNRAGEVVKIRERVGPRRLVFAWSAFAIVELAGGVCADKGLAVGDRLIVVEHSQESNEASVA